MSEKFDECDEPSVWRSGGSIGGGLVRSEENEVDVNASVAEFEDTSTFPSDFFR